LKIPILHTTFLLISLVSFAFAEPERIPLWADNDAPNGDGTTSAAKSSITVFSPEQPNGTIVLICPGGAYSVLVTGAEGTDIALWLNRHGIIGVVLEYRIPHGNSSLPLLDAQQAMRMVRKKAKSWRGDPNRVGVMGFSAGGHLASTLGNHFSFGASPSAGSKTILSSRPDFMALIYPVITMGPLTHGGSKLSLLGSTPTEEAINFFSSEKCVTAKTPPTFLTHAKDDTLVSPENSRIFAAALKEKKIPFEYLELPSGGHGLDGQKGPSWDAWQNNFLKWLVAQKLLPSKTTTGIKSIPSE
jgi:acetyl esterase/lipase